MNKSAKQLAGEQTRANLLDAALSTLRQKGYAATTVDDVCRAAAVTKGSFFHHFSSKEALATAAAQHFADFADRIFRDAPYQRLPDPLDRVLGYVDFRIALLQGPIHQFACLHGTLLQEMYDSHPAVREAIEPLMFQHVAMIERDVAAAVAAREPRPDVDPHTLAVHMQTVLQGALIYAKAANGPAVAIESLRHLRRYIELLFSSSPP